MTQKPPSNSDLSTTWPKPTHDEDQMRVVDLDIEERRREAMDRFFEAQRARRANWRKRRGWDTP